MKFKLLPLCLFSIFATNSYAMETFIVKNIKINGLQRIETGTVLSYLPVKTGDTLEATDADSIINKLYATGFFKDVRLEQQGQTLIIDLAERPVINQITINGDKAFDHDKLIQSLKDSGLADGKIFDTSILDQAVLGLKSEYYNQGLYSVQINTTVMPLERNRVSINIQISEGLAAKIADIKIMGANKFSQSKLLGEMYLTTGNMLSWWTKDNQYSGEKLSGDLESIRTFYLNQGYIEFKINSVQVQLSPDKKSVYITINIAEGKQYRIKTIKIAGDTKNVPLADLNKLITVKSGDIVNQSKLIKDLDAIKSKVGEYGYAFANANPIPEIDQQTQEVSYTLFLDLDKKVYVRKIDISGNDKTRDVVVRRELRQQEAGLYNAAAIKRSKDRLGQTGYFKNTDITTEPVPGINDEVDMKVKVEEANTGSLTMGVGFAQGQGLLLNGSVAQSNLFGSGKSVSLSASTSQLNNNIGLSFTDPYFKPNGTSLGYDLYTSGYTPDKVGYSPYSTQTIGARTRMSVPVSEFDKITFSAGLENTQINLSGTSVPLRFTQFTNQFGSSVYSIPVSVGFSRNTTDSTLWPTKGATFSETIDGSLPGIGGAQYYRFNSQNNWYLPISENFTWRVNGTAGFINPYGSNNTVPFYQNYYMGGMTSIRGFSIGSLGPKDTDGSSLGGTREAIFSNEILFPLPGLKQDKTVRLSAFVDTGSLWGGNSFGLTPEQSFRASYGMGLTWISPLGPIKLSYAIPLVTQPNDSLEPFQFMFGTSF